MFNLPCPPDYNPQRWLQIWNEAAPQFPPIPACQMEHVRWESWHVEFTTQTGIARMQPCHSHNEIQNIIALKHVRGREGRRKNDRRGSDYKQKEWPMAARVSVWVTTSAELIFGLYLCYRWQVLSCGDEHDWFKLSPLRALNEARRQVEQFIRYRNSMFTKMSTYPAYSEQERGNPM